MSGWAGTAGKMLDIGKFLTTDDRGKESASIAGGIVGSLAGQRLHKYDVDFCITVRGKSGRTEAACADYCRI